MKSCFLVFFFKKKNLLTNLTASFPQLDLITDLLGTPPLSALSSACEGARAHILMGPHKPVSVWPQVHVIIFISIAQTFL